MLQVYRPPTIKQRKNARVERWEPITWKPEYEAIVAMHCRGMTNIYIAEVTKFHVVQISNILNTTEAKVIKAQCIENIRKQSFESSETALKELQNNAVANIVSVLSDPDLKTNSPFGVFDRSLSFLKASGRLTGENPVAQHNNTISQTNVTINNSINQLSEGLKAAAEAKRLNSGLSGDSIN